MTTPRVLFSSASGSWATPSDLYSALDAEFHFTLDPCPLGRADDAIFEKDGLQRSWAGQRVYCNPPYGRGIGKWLAKAKEADLAVFLLPARTDTAWWHDQVMGASPAPGIAPSGKADEIRFLRGRLSFTDPTGRADRATFPSVILIYRSQGLGGGALDGAAPTKEG